MGEGKKEYAPVAQGTERLVSTQRVGGSNPLGRAIYDVTRVVREEEREARV